MPTKVQSWCFCLLSTVNSDCPCENASWRQRNTAADSVDCRVHREMPRCHNQVSPQLVGIIGGVGESVMVQVVLRIYQTIRAI